MTPRKTLSHIANIPLTTNPNFVELQKELCKEEINILHYDERFCRQRIFQHIYSNDIASVPTYREEMNNYCKDDNYHPSSIILPEYQRTALVIGNSNLFSFIAEIPAETILIIDINPLVHFYLFKAREIILSASEEQPFKNIQKNLIHKLKNLDEQFYSVSGIEHEIEFADSNHYLYSEKNFVRCKKALQVKTLLPLVMDIFTEYKIQKLGVHLHKANALITFCNLTNVIDYGNFKTAHKDLIKNLKLLPLSLLCQFVVTVYREIKKSNWTADHGKVLTADGLADLSLVLKHRLLTSEDIKKKIIAAHCFRFFNKPKSNSQASPSVELKCQNINV